MRLRAARLKGEKNQDHRDQSGGNRGTAGLGNLIISEMKHGEGTNKRGKMEECLLSGGHNFR